jgi:hypothetical protein
MVAPLQSRPNPLYRAGTCYRLVLYDAEIEAEQTREAHTLGRVAVRLGVGYGSTTTDCACSHQRQARSAHGDFVLPATPDNRNSSVVTTPSLCSQGSDPGMALTILSPAVGNGEP